MTSIAVPIQDMSGFSDVCVPLSEDLDPFSRAEGACETTNFDAAHQLHGNI